MKNLARLLGLYRPYTRWVAASICVSLAATLANIGLMAVSGWFITAMAAAGVAGATMNYFTPAAIIRALAILRTGGRYLDRLLSHEATFRLIGGLRSHVFAGLARLAPAGLGDQRSGDLAERLRGDIDRLELVFLRLVSPFAVALFTALALVAVLAHWSLALAGAAGLVFAFAGLAAPAGAALAGRGPSRAATRLSAQIRSGLVDDLEGLAPLLLTGAHGRHFAALEANMAELLEAERRIAQIGSLGQIMVGLSGEASMLAVLVIGVPLLRSGALAGPELTAAALAALASLEAFGGVAAAFAGLSGALASADRLFGLLDRKANVVEPRVPAMPPARFDLVFENVALTYPGAARPALARIDLTIAPGAHIAVIGESGAGKSSLIDLLVRFRDPTQGEVRLGGTPLRHLTFEALRARIAVVGQNAHIFATTIAENLRLARPSATEDEMWDVLAEVRLDEVARALPSGLESPVGAGGTLLSGGQARRLALARALLSKAPILVLDEPAEGLDPQIERQVLDSLFKRSDGRTLLLLTHRRAGLERMDAIVTLSRGHIVACESYEKFAAKETLLS
jgi:ATP-binding cassette, subfamily C, bacterial CydC